LPKEQYALYRIKVVRNVEWESNRQIKKYIRGATRREDVYALQGTGTRLKKMVVVMAGELSSFRSTQPFTAAIVAI